MDDEKQIDEATAALVRTLYHTSKEEIRVKRQLIRDIEDWQKKFGWRWNRDN